MERYVALYTKYRPQVFDDIVGQEAPIAALRQSVKTGKIGHAYLFCGQRGTGKTTIARVFARAVNCMHPVNGNPCNECASCKAILDGTGMDVIEIDGASNNGVDNIRKICDEVSFAPATSRYKVYIIDEVHMISTAGFNALLKTLEEPPAHAIFIFATTELHQVPNTIVSRCLRFSFKRILPDLIASRLKIICKGEGIKADDTALLKLAMLADGALRDAITMLDQVAVINDGRNKQITVKDVEDVVGVVDTDFLFKMSCALLDGNMRELLDLCSELHHSGRDLVHFTTDLANYMRDLLIIRVLPDPTKHLAYSPDVMQQMYTVANKASAETLTGFIKYLYDENAAMRRAGAMDANFDILMIRLCGRKSKIEPVPLAMPDFAGLQAEAAKKISVPELKVSEPVPKTEEAKETEPAKQAEPVKEALPLKPAEEDKPKAEDKPKEEAKTEEPKKEPPMPAWLRRPDNIKMPEDVKEQQKAESTEETVIATDNSDPDPLADFKSRLNLFDNKKEEEKKEEDKPQETKPSILAGLSDSFLDDIAADESKDDDKKEEAPSVQRQSHVAQAFDSSGLIVQPSTHGVRPANISSEKMSLGQIWTQVLSETGGNLASQLSQASLNVIGDSAYAVFDSRDEKLMLNLRSVPGIKDVSASVKEKTEGVTHFYLCTDSVYRNALAKEEEEKRAAEIRASQQEIIDIAKDNDIPIKFGDE
ncbi:MAG: DNA polymerase III subunit gamma/tau [Clostridiales bacterium]|nr:DNA polymerase III subunit gamma/tau [Clostridiales bacterium]